MEVNSISEFGQAAQINLPRFGGLHRHCIFYKEELCTAPKTRFSICRDCSRIDIKAAVLSLIDKIGKMADEMLNLEATPPEQPPPEL